MSYSGSYGFRDPPRLTGGYYLHWRGETVIGKVIYDALSITSKIHSTTNFVEQMGLQGVVWENVKGAHGYRDRMYWNCISIHYNGADDMGVWLELTGQGCRAFETYGNGDYEGLFREALYNSGQMNITRLDVAYDDDEEALLDIDVLCVDTRTGQFVSRFNDWQVIEGSKGSSVTHGSMKSDLFIRIYDKAAERGFTDGRHWIRVELQLRRERAVAFAGKQGDIGQRFAGVLGNYLRYIDPDGADSNKWRWPMRDYWEQLLAGAARIQLYEKPGAEYNMNNLENFVYRQAGNAISALLEISGQDEFFDRLKKRGTVQNPKYKALMNQYCNSEK